MSAMRPVALLLLSAAAALAGCSDGLRDPDVVRSGAEADLQPGYFATGARITQTGPDGAPRYRIAADRVDQDAGSGSIQLTQPRFDLATERGNWRVSAARGDLPQDASQIDLRGDVLLASQVGPRREPIEIRTASLHFEPQAGRARSRERVTITLAGKTLAGTGLDANLKAQTVRLESDVNGRFLP